jgi:hypothetical protein
MRPNLREKMPFLGEIIKKCTLNFWLIPAISLVIKRNSFDDIQTQKKIIDKNVQLLLHNSTFLRFSQFYFTTNITVSKNHQA